MSEHPASLHDLIAMQQRAAHSIFAPSSSAMWLLCSGSLIPNVLALDDAGWEAAEGTVAHDLAEQWARDDRKPVERLGEIVECEGHEIEITEEMFAYVEDYLRWCETIQGFEDTTFLHFPEERVDLSLFMPIPNQGGTADHFACAPGVLVITDLKYGKGVPVFCAADPEDPRSLVDGRFNGNPQAMLYALGVFLRYDHEFQFQRIVIRICQPRLGYFGTWETSRAELLRFADYVMERAELCLDPEAPRTPGPKQCEFCRVRTTCAAFASYVEEIVSDRFSDLDAPTGTYTVADQRALLETVSDALTVDVFPVIKDPLEIALHDLEKYLPMRRVIEKWFEGISERLTEAALVDEVQLRLYKVVEGRSNRVFVEETDAEKLLLSRGVKAKDLRKTTFVSPAQAEELLHKQAKLSKADAKAALKGLVYQPPGPKSLALRTDSRPELESAGDRFVSLD